MHNYFVLSRNCLIVSLKTNGPSYSRIFSIEASLSLRLPQKINSPPKPEKLLINLRKCHWPLKRKIISQMIYALESHGIESAVLYYNRHPTLRLYIIDH